MSYRHGIASNEDVDAFAGHGFGEKIAFTVGSSYMAGAFLGAALGLYQSVPVMIKRMPWKLRFNTIFNLLGKNATQFGNAFGAAGFMYYMVGSAVNFVFEDELQDFSNLEKNALCGLITGALYKSQRGIRGTVMGGLVGVAIMGGLTLATQKANEKGLASFEIRF